MGDGLARGKPEGAIIPDRELGERAADYARASRAPNTIRNYRGAVRDFDTWCRGRAYVSLPATPQTIALYATFLAEQGYKPTTIDGKMHAIAAAHRMAGHVPPTYDGRVKGVLEGIRRRYGEGAKQADPITPKTLERLVDALERTPRGAQGYAMLTVGFSAAMRRSELVALDVEDLEWTDEGVILTVKKSKTDQTGVGERTALPRLENRKICPVRVLAGWLRLAQIEEGPVFRAFTRWGRMTERRASVAAVYRIIKQTAARAGLEGQFSPHSLRAGLATSAAKAGKSQWAILRQGRWKDIKTLQRYIREGELFSDNAADL